MSEDGRSASLDVRDLHLDDDDEDRNEIEHIMSSLEEEDEVRFCFFFAVVKHTERERDFENCIHMYICSIFEIILIYR